VLNNYGQDVLLFSNIIGDGMALPSFLASLIGVKVMLHVFIITIINNACLKISLN